jgi:hypothetical protein
MSAHPPPHSPAPLLLLGACLVSCAAPSSLEAVSATGDAIVFSYADDEAAAAARQAALYCANLGRAAHLSGFVDQSDGRRVATFECRAEPGPG